MYGCATKSQQRKFKAQAQRKRPYGDWWPATKHSMLMAHRRRSESRLDKDAAIELADLSL